MTLTLEQFKIEAESIHKAAHQFFNDPETEALGGNGGQRAVLSQPTYRALVVRANVLVGDYNSDPAEIAARDAAASRGLVRPSSYKYMYLSEARWVLRRGWPNLRTRLKNRKSKVRIDGEQRNKQFSIENPDYIFGSDVKKEFGISISEFEKVALIESQRKLDKYGLDSCLCDYDYDGASWGHHTQELEQARSKNRIVCICQTPLYSAFTMGLPDMKSNGRKIYSRKLLFRLARKKAATKAKS